MKTHCGWDAFPAFDETPDYFLLYLDDPKDRRTAVKAQLIPKRAIPSCNDSCGPLRIAQRAYSSANRGISGRPGAIGRSFAHRPRSIKISSR